MGVSIRRYVPADQKDARLVVLRGFKDFGFEYAPQFLLERHREWQKNFDQKVLVFLQLCNSTRQPKHDSNQ